MATLEEIFGRGQPAVSHFESREKLQQSELLLNIHREANRSF